jgi:putative ABC transport system permease protein
MVLRKLAFSNFARHKVRVALTVAAVALSVSLVVSVTSGYASMEATALKFLSRFMGSMDAQIYRRTDGIGGVEPDLIAQLRGDPDVGQVVERLEVRIGIIDQKGRPANRPAEVIGAQRPADKQVETIELTKGRWFDSSTGNEAVIDDAAAQLLSNRDQPGDYTEKNATSLVPGDKFVLPNMDRKLELTVVGIVHKPSIIAMSAPSIYVPIDTLRRFVQPDGPPPTTRVMIDVKPGREDSFADRWTDKLAAADPLLRLRMARDNRREMKKNMLGVELLSYFGGAVSMLAATFIVFSALSMGVSERQRVLAMLRAIGLVRAQVGKLVIAEGLLLGAAGVIIGVPLGILWVYLLTLKFDRLFIAGVAINWRGIAFGGGGLLVASVIAAFLPAWTAMRVSPLEAMSPLATPATSKMPWKLALLGLILLAIDPLLMHGPKQLGGIDPDLIRTARVYGHFALGVPSFMTAFFLLSPLFVWVTERTLGPLVAKLFNLHFALLRQQLSSGIWRAAGTCTALMVGLAVLVVMQTQGRSALSGWKLPDKFPDAFIFVGNFDYKRLTMRGIEAEGVAKLESVPGVKRVMPIAIAAPELGSSVFSLAGASMLPNATMFIGIDPDKAFDMMQLDFRQGNPAEAQRLLKRGRYVLVTEEYHQLKNINKGDTLKLKRPDGTILEYSVAGVVWSPGMDVFVSMFDVGRQFDQRTVASVFGTHQDVQRDFGVTETNLFAADLNYDAGQKNKVMERVRETLGQWGVRIYDVRQIKYHMTEGMSRVLLFASSIAFAAMAVASLGVTNTIMASVRSRRWQFGVMRAVGVTRSQLLRLVLAEAMLLGLVGCAMGLTGGVLLSIDARGLNAFLVGYIPPFVFPWGIVWIGVGVVMGVSLLASIWPAIAVARTEPLTLLQAGRATA